MKGLASVLMMTCKRKIWCGSELGALLPMKEARLKLCCQVKNHQKKVTFSISLPPSNESKVKMQSK